MGSVHRCARQGEGGTYRHFGGVHERHVVEADDVKVSALIRMSPYLLGAVHAVYMHRVGPHLDPCYYLHMGPKPNPKVPQQSL
jgi:hypothetical protein